MVDLNIEDIRLSVDLHLSERERSAANLATDKAIKKILGDLDDIDKAKKDDQEFLMDVGRYLLALKELVNKDT